MAGSLLDRFQRLQPELEINQTDTDLIRIAGLCHDLGHGPFSHVFDGEFMKRRCPDSKFTHEQMSLKMLDYLIDDNNIDIEQDHIRFVKDVIMASEHAKSSKGQKSREREFLYVVFHLPLRIISKNHLKHTDSVITNTKIRNCSKRKEFNRCGQV